MNDSRTTSVQRFKTDWPGLAQEDGIITVMTDRELPYVPYGDPQEPAEDVLRRYLE
jgi:hypothetical protein